MKNGKREKGKRSTRVGERNGNLGCTTRKEGNTGTWTVVVVEEWICSHDFLVPSGAVQPTYVA